MRILNFLANNVFGMLIPPIIMWAIWTGISHLISFVFKIDFTHVYALVGIIIVVILGIIVSCLLK